MLTALVLICSLAVTPDTRSCNPDNAYDVIRLAEQFGNPATCFMHGQAMVAGTAFGDHFNLSTQSLKVLCRPSQKVPMRAHAFQQESSLTQ